MSKLFRVPYIVGILAFAPASLSAQESPKIRILFLGDQGHHQPAARFRQLQPILAERGVDMTYTESAAALDPKILNRYDGLLIYANTEKITPDQEKTLLDYVAGGKGFIPVHCASYCFLNSPRYIELVGAQFKRHGTGTFRTTIAAPDHPIMRGLEGFESWDETYVHHKHNDKERYERQGASRTFRGLQTNRTPRQTSPGGLRQSMDRRDAFHRAHGPCP